MFLNTLTQNEASRKIMMTRVAKGDEAPLIAAQNLYLTSFLLTGLRFHRF
jgi:hypothetical protein